MIRILYMSDLHLEMERPRLAVPGWAGFLRRRTEIARHPHHGPLLDDVGRVDLVVMAGDIHKGLRGIIYAEEVNKFLGAPVVMVAGNHEYYYHDMTTLLPGLRKANAKTGDQVQFLENALARFDIRGRALYVIAATLWTDYALHGDPAAGIDAARRRMNDHRFIHLDGRPFMPEDAAAMHAVSLQWLRKTLARLQEDDPGAATVIVTHHAPTAKVLGERQGGIAPAYASEVLYKFGARPPDLWIHGHTHFRHASVIDGVKLVSAPRGYVGYEGDSALQFRPGLTSV